MNKNEIEKAHRWIKDLKGLASCCEKCGKKDGYFEWSNKNHQYQMSEEDWQMLCKPCHSIHDIQNGLRVYSKYEVIEGLPMVCPRQVCNYKWHSRVSEPKACPMCKKYLPAQTIK